MQMKHDSENQQIQTVARSPFLRQSFWVYVLPFLHRVFLNKSTHLTSTTFAVPEWK